MRVVIGLSLTAKSAVWALVDTKDGTILADEVVTLDSANEIARAVVRSIESFAAQSERGIDGVRMTWSDDAQAGGNRLRTEVRLLGIKTVETVSQHAAREARNRTARYIAPHLVLAYGAARAEQHTDDRRVALRRLVSPAPVAAATAASVAVVAGGLIYVLTGSLPAADPVTDTGSVNQPTIEAAHPPVAAPMPVPTMQPGLATAPSPVLATAPGGGEPPGEATDIATARPGGAVQEIEQTLPAAISSTPAEQLPNASTIGEPHLTGSQLAAGPVQAVVAPLPAATPTSTTPTPPRSSNGPLSVILGALP